jgi:S1-C subfamily serine protease
VKSKRGAGVGTVVAASVLSAVLASGGTVLVLSQTGALDRPAPASSTGSATPTLGQQPVTINENSAVIASAEKVGPAVVKISVEGASQDPFSGTPTEGVGSGLIYDANGWIVTNRHVVADADKLTVELKDGRKFEGKVYGIDTLTDLAIVKVDETGLPTAPIGDSASIQVGQEAIAIGSPLGTFTDSVTSGIISALGRSIPVEDGSVLTNLLQTDTAINPGNSGGPLLDPSGKVIGINTAGASQAQGIGFAIPIDIAKPLLAQASAGKPLARPYLGIRFETIDPTIQKANDLPVDHGAWIPTASAAAGLGNGQGGNAQDPNGFGQGIGQPAAQDSIVAGGPADQGGLKPGDIITAVDGTALDATHPLDLVMSQYGPGTSVKLDVLRDGQTTSVTVVLGTRPTTA